MLGDSLEVKIPRGRSHLGQSAWDCGCSWRHDNRRIGMVLGDSGLNLVLIVGAVAGERGERIGELVKKRTGPRAVVDLPLRPFDDEDLATVGIVADVQFLLGSPPGGAVLFDEPFAAAAELNRGAVREQMQRAGSEPLAQRHGQRPGPAAQGRMVRHRKIESKQVDKGADQTFGLSQCQTTNGTQRQRRGDRQGRGLRLPARRGPQFRLPCGDRRVGEPDGEAAPLPQRRIIFRPIRDPIPRHGNMMTMRSVMLERHGR